MNKRLRKKKHLKQFREFGFEFTISYHPVEQFSEAYDKLLDEILSLISRFHFDSAGSFGENSYKGFMSVQNWRVNADEMKKRLQTSLQNLPDVTKIEFGKNIDAWYENDVE